MIPKGNQRAGGQQLATHLLNEYDNDRVEVVEVRGAIAPDLHGAFAEWYAQSKATNCHKYLYSLSINPDHTQGPFNRKHYDDFIRRTEKRLGLAGQPRAVVFHVKHGREHCHVVWSRIDTDKMRAVQLSHDRQKLRAVAQEYARDHNITLPPGMRNDRGKDRFPEHEKTENLAEKQQEERSGISKQQRREQITNIWRESSEARSFIKTLDAAGYYLARGDKRPYVLVDLYGEVHSLSRQLIGVKDKEMKQRLSTYPMEKLPSVLDAQDDARERRQALIAKELEQKQGSPEEKPKTIQERRDELQRTQALRRGKLDARREQLTERHTAERKALSDLQSAAPLTSSATALQNSPKACSPSWRVSRVLTPSPLSVMRGRTGRRNKHTASRRRPSRGVTRARWRTSNTMTAASPRWKNASAGLWKPQSAARPSAASRHRQRPERRRRN